MGSYDDVGGGKSRGFNAEEGDAAAEHDGPLGLPNLLLVSLT